MIAKFINSLLLLQALVFFSYLPYDLQASINVEKESADISKQIVLGQTINQSSESSLSSNTSEKSGNSTDADKMVAPKSSPNQHQKSTSGSSIEASLQPASTGKKGAQQSDESANKNSSTNNNKSAASSAGVSVDPGLPLSDNNPVQYLGASSGRYPEDCSGGGHLVANNGIAIIDGTTPVSAVSVSYSPQAEAMSSMPKIDNANQSMINNLNRMSATAAAASNRHQQMINPTLAGMSFDTPIESLDMSFPLPMVSNYPINNPVLNSAILEKLKQLPECKFRQLCSRLHFVQYN